MKHSALSARASFFGALSAGVLGTAVFLIGGCKTVQRVDGWVNGPFFTPKNVSSVKALPAEVRRVAVLPLAWNGKFPESTTLPIVKALRMQLTRSERFEVVVIDEAYLRRHFTVSSISSVDPIPTQIFDLLRREYAADAVLLCDITEFHAYPPLAIGVRARLVVLDEALTTLWAFDTIFSASSRPVANSAQRFAREERRDALPNSPAGVLNSPSSFASYVFSQTFATIPLRIVPKVQPEKTDKLR